MKILLVEDERMTRVALAGTLRKEGYEVTPCPDGHSGLEALRSGGFDLVLTDLNLPGPDGLEILQEAAEMHPGPRVIIMTAFASTETAVQALRMGAHDYVTKPFQTDEILTRVRNLGLLHDVEEENRALKARIAGEQERLIVGNSPSIQELLATIEAIAPGEYNVLIQGPSGTGKEMVARTIHQRSLRAKGPFVAVNCSAIPDTLVESELFGYRKGAFTGADRDHQGYFLRAHGGSLFLDEVDDLPLAVQIKLLRVIQEREIQPVGGGTAHPVDFRLISASKKDLKVLVDQGDFREDLYYRLNVIPMLLPTLAERKEDIPALVEHFVARHGKQGQFTLDMASFRALMDYHWPGNVRELGNVVERMLALPGVPVEQLVHGLSSTSPSGATPTPAQDLAPLPTGDALDYRSYMQDCEDRLLDWALQQAEGNITGAARLLGLPRSTLRSKLERGGD
jgi:DNA-binding NtrC family response regulator